MVQLIINISSWYGTLKITIGNTIQGADSTDVSLGTVLLGTDDREMDIMQLP